MAQFEIMTFTASTLALYESLKATKGDMLHVLSAGVFADSGINSGFRIPYLAEKCYSDQCCATNMRQFNILLNKKCRYMRVNM